MKRLLTVVLLLCCGCDKSYVNNGVVTPVADSPLAPGWLFRRVRIANDAEGYEVLWVLSSPSGETWIRPPFSEVWVAIPPIVVESESK